MICRAACLVLFYQRNKGVRVGEEGFLGEGLFAQNPLSRGSGKIPVIHNRTEKSAKSYRF